MENTDQGKMIVNNVCGIQLAGDTNTNGMKTRRMTNNGRRDTKKLVVERKSITRSEMKRIYKDCCQSDASKKQDECDIRSNSPIKESSEKGALRSPTVTEENTDCKRKSSQRRVKKLKLDDDASDESSYQPTRMTVLNEKIGKHTTVVKTCVNGRERAMYQCGYCKRWKTSVALKSNMVAHLEKHETGVLRCAHCGHDAVNAPALAEHVARAHTRQPQLVCALCGKECYSRKQLRQHEDIHNLHPRECRLCGQKMRSLTQLKKHVKTEHAGDGLYSCDECRKTFIFKKWFDAHKSKQACGLKITCSLCGAKVVKGGGMSTHMRRVHEGEKRVLCSYCPFTAFTKTQVRLHERTHTRDHPFTCHLCQFSAAKKYQLTSHMRTHTGEKPFHCELCPFASSWKVQLRTHQAVHVSANSVTCNVCAVVYKNASSLRAHRLREHGQSLGNHKVTATTIHTKSTAGCEKRSTKTSASDITSAISLHDTNDPEETSEEARECSDEVTSYIIVDIERLGLETVAVVFLDDTTDSVAQNPPCSDEAQCIEIARV